MQDSWFNHNTDKMILLLLVMILWGTTLWASMHIFHHDTDSMEAIAFISFMTGSVSTVLGALVMIMTGRAARADGQTGNGAPPVPSVIITPKPPDAPGAVKVS